MSLRMEEFRSKRKPLNSLVHREQIASLKAEYPAEFEQYEFELKEEQRTRQRQSEEARANARDEAEKAVKTKSKAKREEARNKAKDAEGAAHQYIAEQLAEHKGDFIAVAESCAALRIPYALYQPLWEALVKANAKPSEVHAVIGVISGGNGEAEALIQIEFARVFVPLCWVYATEASTCYNLRGRHMQAAAKAGKELLAYADKLTDSKCESLIVKYARRVQRFAFHPGKPPLSEYSKTESDGQGEQTFTCFNLFRGWRLKPLKRKVKASEVAVIIEHIAYVLGEGDLAPKDRKLTPLFLDWLAFQIQRPGVRIKWTWVIVSTGEQIGKDSLATIIERIIGHWNMTRVAGSELEDKRNTFLTEGHFAIVNEAMIPYRAMDNVRTIITEQMIKVRFLYGEWSRLESFAIIIFFSNKENALGLTDDSKRFVVVINEAARRPDAYYKTLWESIDGDGPQLFMSFLEQRDISKFEANQPPPMTGDMARMIEANTSGEDAALSAWIENRERPFDRELATEADLISLLKSERGLSVRPTTLRKMLARHGCRRLGENGVGVKLDLNVKPKAMRLWALDSVREWQALSGDLAPLIRGYALSGQLPYSLAAKKAVGIAATNPQATAESGELIEASVTALHAIRQGKQEAEPSTAKLAKRIKREARAEILAEIAEADAEEGDHSL